MATNISLPFSTQQTNISPSIIHSVSNKVNSKSNVHQCHRPISFGNRNYQLSTNSIQALFESSTQAAGDDTLGNNHGNFISTRTIQIEEANQNEFQAQSFVENAKRATGINDKKNLVVIASGPKSTINRSNLGIKSIVLLPKIKTAIPNVNSAKAKNDISNRMISRSLQGSDQKSNDQLHSKQSTISNADSKPVGFNKTSYQINDNIQINKTTSVDSTSKRKYYGISFNQSNTLPDKIFDTDGEDDDDDDDYNINLIPKYTTAIDCKNDILTTVDSSNCSTNKSSSSESPKTSNQNKIVQNNGSSSSTINNNKSFNLVVINSVSNGQMPIISTNANQQIKSKVNRMNKRVLSKSKATDTKRRNCRATTNELNCKTAIIQNQQSTISIEIHQERRKKAWLDLIKQIGNKQANIIFKSNERKLRQKKLAWDCKKHFKK